MTTIADSSAVRTTQRIFPQHQAALTLLQSRLSVPQLAQISWLDLACGRGQIIASLDKNLSQEARAKINFLAYDLNQGFARETAKTAQSLGFASFQTKIGDLSDFDRILPPGAFDFITLTNTIHEIEPSSLSRLLANCVSRLSGAGTLFIYDMEEIKPPELGAVPWTRDEIRRIVHKLLESLGASNYRPELALWNHKSCNGWNVLLDRQYFGRSSDEIRTNMEAAVTATGAEISIVLRAKLLQCRTSLETFTMHAPETVEEQEDKERLLYDFWALSRAVERIP